MKSELLNKINKHYEQKTLLKAIFRKNITKEDQKRIVELYHKKLFMASKPNKPTYEPLKIDGKLFDSKRTWEDRWEAIRSQLLEYKASSVMDIGCAQGWFIRLAAEELGCFSLGIEMHDKNLLPSELARLYDGVEGCAIMKATLTPANIVKLPLVDVVLCLSVVHHIIYKQGIEDAREFIKALGTRAKKAIIFEMGTPEEANARWSNDMPEMPKGQNYFISEFLKSAGMVNIKIIGSSLSLKKEASRTLFVAEPRNQAD